MEAPHKYLVKIFYDRTNKSEAYLDQICAWNTRETNIKAMNIMLLHHLGTTSKISHDIATKVTAIPRDPQLLVNIRCKPIPQDIA